MEREDDAEAAEDGEGGLGVSAYYPKTRSGIERRLSGISQATYGQFIYLLKAGQFVKVGRAGDVIHRISQMQTGCPWEIKPITAFGVMSNKDAGRFEKEMHSRMHVRRSYGEWFECGVQQAVSLLAIMACPHIGMKAYTFNNEYDDVVMSCFERELACRDSRNPFSKESQAIVEDVLSCFQNGKGVKAKKKYKSSSQMWCVS